MVHNTTAKAKFYIYFQTLSLHDPNSRQLSNLKLGGFISPQSKLSKFRRLLAILNRGGT